MDKSRNNRLLELGKDLLILLLACSAVFLVTRTLMTGGVGGLLREESGPGAGAAEERPSGVVWPVRIALSSWNGESMMRMGVQYDREGCEEQFQPVASLLREALSSPGSARSVTEREWRRALSEHTNLYFDLLGDIPLSVLSGWLSGADNGLEGTVRRLCLAADGEEVTLYYRDESDGNYYARKAEVVTPEQLESAVQGIADNGAVFAFELTAYGGLDGDTMILSQQPEPRVYEAANPLSGEEGLSRDGRLGQLLRALSFPDSSYIYSGSGTDQVIRIGNDTLRVSGEGVASYNVTERERSRYLVPSQGASPTALEAAEACRRLAEGAAGAMSGAARLYLRELRQAPEGWIVDFGYCLDGAAVQVGDAGYAAHFIVEGNEITQFTLQLRTYTDTGTRSIVLPEPQALAAMEALDRRGGELALCYRDRGGDRVSAGWVAG